MKIVVAAAVSQIGYWILRQAAQNGHQAIAGFHRRRFETPVADETWTAIDLQHPAAELTDGRLSGADAFIHCGPPQFSPGAARLAAALKCRTIVAFGSTSALYHDLPRPYGDPVKAAMLRRIEAEFADTCRHHRIAGILFRPTLVYGAGMDRNVCRLARMLTRYPAVPLPRRAEGLRQPIHAADIAAIALQAAADTAILAPGQSRLFDIGGGERLPYRDMVRRIATAIGRKPHLIPCPGLAEAARIAALVRPSLSETVSALYRMDRDQVVENGDAARAFGFEPRPFSPAAESLLSPIHPVTN